MEEILASLQKVCLLRHIASSHIVGEGDFVPYCADFRCVARSLAAMPLPFLTYVSANEGGCGFEVIFQALRN